MDLVFEKEFRYYWELVWVYEVIKFIGSFFGVFRWVYKGNNVSIMYFDFSVDSFDFFKGLYLVV